MLQLLMAAFIFQLLDNINVGGDVVTGIAVPADDYPSGTVLRY